jgi:hypothetical protein
MGFEGSGSTVQNMTVWSSISRALACCETGLLSPPTWVDQFLGKPLRRAGQPISGGSVCVREGGDFSLVSICLSDARDLSAEDFQKQTADVYRAIERELKAGPARHPVRVWNHLPDIHAPSSEAGFDRYMAFNAGRFQAYSDWLGGAGAFDQTVPSASAVGHDGRELVIHALASRRPGIAIANPRQIAPYRYSRRFGPLPPCFARATVITAGEDSARKILIGGTASIRGEESIYLDDIARQTSETFHNLAHLIRAATTEPCDASQGLPAAEVRRWLARFQNLRIYYLREADRDFIASRIAEDFAKECQLEFVRADLCRAELLVEIEGLARG